MATALAPLQDSKNTNTVVQGPPTASYNMRSLLVPELQEALGPVTAETLTRTGSNGARLPDKEIDFKGLQRLAAGLEDNKAKTFLVAAGNPATSSDFSKLALSYASKFTKNNIDIVNRVMEQLHKQNDPKAALELLLEERQRIVDAGDPKNIVRDTDPLLKSLAASMGIGEEGLRAKLDLAAVKLHTKQIIDTFSDYLNLPPENRHALKETITQGDDPVEIIDRLEKKLHGRVAFNLPEGGEQVFENGILGIIREEKDEAAPNTEERTNALKALTEIMSKEIELLKQRQALGGPQIP